MVRNFALTFVAVMLRLEMPFLTILFGETTGLEIVAKVVLDIEFASRERQPGCV